jgi:hypothetical protein
MTRDELVAAMRRAGWEVTGLHTHGAYEVWTRPGAPFHTRVTLPAAFVMFTAEGKEMLSDAVKAFARAEGPRLLVAVEAVLADHVRRVERKDAGCRACGQIWPCSTVRAIKEAQS